jgi:hypothetical protein
MANITIRNFDCPKTEAPCARGECKKDARCAIREEAAPPRPAPYWVEFSKRDVDREMHKIATAVVEVVYRAKYGKRIGAEMLR